jgi:heavy metal sensor kinase
MKSILNPGSLRHRLTLWYGALFGLLLLLQIGVATYVHYRQLVDQVFHGEIEDVETAEGLLYQTPDGRILMHEDYFNQPRMPMQLERFFEVLDSDGNIYFLNKKLDGLSIGGPLLPREGIDSYNQRVDRLSDKRSVFVISHAHRIGTQKLILRLAYDRAPVLHNVWQFFSILLLLAPLGILIAAVVVFQLTSSALSPLDSMVRRAERITAERLNERLPVEDPHSDLGHVARAFNELLRRLEESFAQLKRFTADASHELRTPLSSLRSMGEVGLQVDRSDKEYREIIASMLEEVSRLTQLVESLLQISRADSGQIVLKPSEFSLFEMVQETVSLVVILAEEKHQSISVTGSEKLMVHADRAILRQAVLNLIDNAIKYSPPETRIYVSVERVDGGTGQIKVCDQGAGIPPGERTLIFNRFYRTDEGRSTVHGGAGLGLSIAQWAVEAHGGTIGVHSGPDRGSCFFVVLPLRDRGPLDHPRCEQREPLPESRERGGLDEQSEPGSSSQQITNL